ncbi:S9 family peptidase [Simiduia aestuariiviva]|uniref:Acyl-peptide hydrolase n=1 Tax=Simiduia aestuariiviva TaxID=1510459 RepID=A0A839UI17_9GAMM|nr:S9 family peptidase [Simiduia aestuariiviva]MBB3167684.1 dipeptidyl aminopeptidase/acylaminoacyl peptidase [Simiduia aestuariiviva]
MPFLRRTAALLCGALCLFMAGLVNAAPMQLTDVFQLEYASNPQPHPDGKHVIFVRNYFDHQADKKRSNLWQVAVKTGHTEPLTSGLYNDDSPRLSPDGKRLAFISNRTGSAQIHMLWLDSGRTAVISQLTSGPSQLTWSPDGKQLFFTQFVNRAAKPPIALKGKPEQAKWAKPPIFIDETYYRIDGVGYLKSGFQQIFSIDANGGSARQLTHADMHHFGHVEPSPDGKFLYFSAVADREGAPIDSALYRLALDSLAVEKILDRNGPDTHPRLSPDGKTLAFLGFEDQLRLYEVTRLHLLDINSGVVSVLTDDLDRDINDAQWRPDGKGLVISYDDHGETHLAWQPRKGKRKLLSRAVGGTTLGRPYASGDFSVVGNHVAFTHNDVSRPAEVALADVSKGKARQLTQLNDDFSRHVQLGEIEELNYQSSLDKLPLQAWIVYPPNFDPAKKYPLMLEIHGGPVANYGPRFSAELQLFAAAGYVVVYANPRGSDSYGPDFVNEIHHNYPSKDYNDLMDAVDQVIAKGFVNADQLFVTGGSGGGVLTAWIVGHTDRFKAAVVAKPVINWFSFSLTADKYPYFSRYWFAKKPWEDIAQYMARSPISYVGKVTTPTMLLTGEADYRTPMSETEQYYQALKLAGVKTAMVRIPNAGHSIAARPSNLMHKVAYILWWFEQHGGPSPANSKAHPQ